MPDMVTPGKERVGGWLLVLCILLLVWGPVNLGLAASRALAALSIRGVPLGVLLIARVAVTSFGIAAAIALIARRAAAVTMAKRSLVLSAVMDLFVYATPFFPSNRRPGETVFYVGFSVIYYGAWLAYLFRSKRVRDTFDL